MKYIPRAIEPRLLKAASQFPVVALTGPRQVGKSTLLVRLFPRHKYVSFDDPTLLAEARRDPKLFLESCGERVILDEIQYFPELLRYIKLEVDRDRGTNGRFLLTGSQVFHLTQGMTESLAGRVAPMELLGLSNEELGRGPRSLKTLCGEMFRGYFPSTAVHGVEADEFYSGYLRTYLERDLRHLIAVRDLRVFQDFLELLAARAGSLLNLAEISKECGASLATVRGWLSALEATRIVYCLRPYHRNISKRVIKSRKVYFTDTGLLAHLLRLPGPDSIAAGPIAGPVFENLVVSESLKARFNHPTRAEMYFFRDSHHNEADLLIDHGSGRITLAEIKFTKTPQLHHLTSLNRVRKNFRNSSSVLLTLADDARHMTDEIRLLPWHQVHRILDPQVSVPASVQKPR